MVIKKIYNEDTRTEKAWFDSSMIYYTEMVESETENKGNLFVTFKNGSCYVYKDVSLGDYVLFIGGGTDASQGKTLNKVIKTKYDFENMGKSDMEALNEEFQKLVNEDKNVSNDIENTYFISGHRNITEDEFEFNYIPLINMALKDNPNAKFIMGDYYGCDIMAQNYLLDIVGLEPERITVYHMLDSPRNANIKVINFKGGYKSDDERDADMTRNSSADIALVRSNKELSGTAQNILRRYLLKTF